MKTLLLAAAFACLSLGAIAGECEFPFDKTVGEFSAAGAPPVIIPADKLAAIVDDYENASGLDIGEVTRGFIAQAGNKLILGLEVDDCLIPPIVIGSAVSAPKPKLSGKNADGETGA